MEGEQRNGLVRFQRVFPRTSLYDSAGVFVLSTYPNETAHYKRHAARVKWRRRRFPDSDATLRSQSYRFSSSYRRLIRSRKQSLFQNTSHRRRMEHEVDAWIAQLSQCKQLSETDVKTLCERVRVPASTPCERRSHTLFSFLHTSSFLVFYF
jgi:hypothetical protein